MNRVGPFLGGVALLLSTTTALAQADRPSGATELRFGPGTRLALDIGTLPQPSMGVGGAATAWTPSGRFEAMVLYYLPRTSTFGPQPAAALDVSLVTGAFHGCARRRAIPVSACVGFEVGSMKGTSVGLDASSSARAGWMALTAALGGYVHASDRVQTRLELALVVPMTDTNFSIDEFGGVYAPADASVRLRLGVDWQAF